MIHELEFKTNKRMLDAMARAALNLRLRTRHFIRDIRVNTYVAACMWKLVDELIEDPYSELKHVTLTFLEKGIKKGRARNTGPRASKGKRKRDDDEEDGDFKPARNGKW
jgi:hypothetical protein